MWRAGRKVRFDCVCGDILAQTEDPEMVSGLVPHHHRSLREQLT